MISFGCDVLLERAGTLRRRRFALLAHAASITSDRRPLHLALRDSEAGAPHRLFGPEHGYYAVEQDMIPSEDERDPLTGSPIASLYGDSVASLRPAPEAFDGLDLLLIDLQDAGSRYYTYAATAVWAAEAATAAGVEVWVLDRPNPLGGDVIEGNLLEEGFHSFVGAFRMPVRHGLTLGELVLLEARRRGFPRMPRVLTMRGWQRNMLWDDTGLPWIAPSPNLPTPTTAVLYPGGCLIEATELSEGRGTTRPFQLIGAPGLDAGALSEALNARRLPGLSFLPTFFRPQFQKHAGQVCAGVELVVHDPQAVRGFRAGVEILNVFYHLGGERFAWREAPYEFVSDRPAIDLLAGCSALRRHLEAGSDPLAWCQTWAGDEAAFAEERQEVLLYG